MIKPSDIPSLKKIQRLEEQIDSAILKNADINNKTIVIEISTLSDWFFDGWQELRPKYEEYWVIDALPYGCVVFVPKE